MGKENRGGVRQDTTGSPFKLACTDVFESVYDALPAECTEIIKTWPRDPTLTPDELVLELADAAASSSSAAAIAVLGEIAATLEEIISGETLPHPLQKEALGLLRDFCGGGASKKAVEAVRAKVCAVTPRPVPILFFRFVKDICARRSAKVTVPERHVANLAPFVPCVVLKQREPVPWPAASSLSMQGNELPVWGCGKFAVYRRVLELARELWRMPPPPSWVMCVRKGGEEVVLFCYAHRRQRKRARGYLHQ